MSLLGRIWRRLKALLGSGNAGRVDPRPFLAGAAPGLWASDHLEETRQGAKGWQFVAVRFLAKSAAAARLNVHRLVEPGREASRLGREAVASEPAKARRLRAKAAWWREQGRRLKALQATGEGDGLAREPQGIGHPLVRLLRKPNPEQSGAALRYAAAQQLSITGTAYLWAVKNGLGRPVELYVPPTGLMMPRQPTKQYPEGWYYLAPSQFWGTYPQGDLWSPGFLGRALLTGWEIDARDVHPVRWPHPLYPSEGLSPLDAGALWVDLANEMDRSAWYFFANAERPGLIFEQDAHVDPHPDDVKQFREDLRSDSAGTPNTGKHFLAPKGIKANRPPGGPSELDYTGSRPQARDFNLALHSVPAIAAGIAEAGSHAAFFSSLLQATELAVQPMLDLLAEETGEFLGPHFEGGPYEVGLKAKAVNDPQQLDARKRTHVAAGNTIKVDEFRALDGLPPLGGAEGQAFAGAKPAAAQAPKEVPADQRDRLDDEWPDEQSTGTREPARDRRPGENGKHRANGHGRRW